MTVPKIHAAMCRIMKRIDPIPKDRKNEQQGYKFRGVDDCYLAVQQAMAEEGVHSTTEILETSSWERPTRNNGVMTFVRLKCRFRFWCAEDGSHCVTDASGVGSDTGDKMDNKAMSVADKYALLQAFKIPTEDPKDPENESPEVVQNNNQKNPQNQKPQQGQAQPDPKIYRATKEQNAKLKLFFDQKAPNLTQEDRKKIAGDLLGKDMDSVQQLLDTYVDQKAYETAQGSDFELPEGFN